MTIKDRIIEDLRQTGKKVLFSGNEKSLQWVYNNLNPEQIRSLLINGSFWWMEHTKKGLKEYRLILK